MNKRGNNNSHNQWSLYVSKLKSCKKRRKEYCPICQKKILVLHYNKHVEQCSRISELRAKMYNEDVANMNRSDECAICLDSMECGQRIARLKCLCVYHKACIDLWLNKNIWCPNHPPP
ncbi:E3 ubiquitin-protein ligase ZNRF1-like [Metopolophium dirhodum]|uniref:E3 ubiquitin-protein ligase ZNRF1-like n=1 Tax=Metopolophium dirhodum TaxID=44670 RepID=UPI00298F49DD|nr:E3 ubiquitin-protein ligase ZNRF1-like [Metopolophium dirhodum]